MNKYFIQTGDIINGKGRVEFIHYNPSDLPQEMIQTGKIVERFEEPESVEGKMIVPYYFEQTNEVVYEYEDIPKTETELLNDEIVNLQENQASMILEGLDKDLEIIQLKEKIEQLEKLIRGDK